MDTKFDNQFPYCSFTGECSYKGLGATPMCNSKDLCGYKCSLIVEDIELDHSGVIENKNKFQYDNPIIQPSDIEALLEKNYQDRRINDEHGFTGEYRLSEKQILDIIIDLREQGNEQ